MLPDWAVIACDQFTSQPEYWRAVRAQTEGKPSAYHIVFPEAELGRDEEERIFSINAAMRSYLDAGLFRSFPASCVYVERQLLDGSVRRGVVGVIDLEDYDYHSGSLAPIRATEQTVQERIPPRVRIREDAALETSHAILLMDDEAGAVLDSLTAARDDLPLVYDFPLMQGGGRIVGRLVSGEAAHAFDRAVADYEARTVLRFAETGRAPLLYAVGDGNHSLATAKTCWEALKAQDPSLAGSQHPARYAMVELQNIRDAEQKFEPIHRLLLDVSKGALLQALEPVCAEGGYPVEWIAGGQRGTITLDQACGALPVAILQPVLDRFLREHGGHIDYIHGDDTAAELAQREDAVALLLPNISKDDFFRGIVMDGVLPRKTFSMGHAQEKRYYLECRRIK
jgi:hypothetical protein